MESRYARQEVFPFVGLEGQKRIKAASVAIVGCGGLGSVASELLARAGIGTLVLIDHDIVTLTNLQRQALYKEIDIAKPKASALKSHIGEINKEVKVTAHDTNLDFENISKLLSKVNIVLDCTDNIDTRLLLNEFCAKSALHWIHAAAIEDKGVVLNMIPKNACFRCVFPLITQSGSCEEQGVLNITTYQVACMQVAECLKFILGKKVEEDLLRISVLNHNIEHIKVKKDQNCPVCNGKYSLLEGEVPELCVKECKTRKGWSVKPKHNIKLDLAGIKKKFKVVLDADILVVIDYEGEIIIHGYGELLFKELKDAKRIKEIAEEIYKAGGA